MQTSVDLIQSHTYYTDQSELIYTNQLSPASNWPRIKLHTASACHENWESVRICFHLPQVHVDCGRSRQLLQQWRICHWAMSVLGVASSGGNAAAPETHKFWDCYSVLRTFGDNFAPVCDGFCLHFAMETVPGAPPGVHIKWGPPLGEREIHMRLEDDHLSQEIQLECEAYSLSKCVGLVLPSNVTRLATGIFHAKWTLELGSSGFLHWQ